MKNLKRVLSLVLATVMVIGMMVVGASAADYKDADKIDYTEAVDVMSAVGMIEGYAGNFGPEGKIDRAGATKLITYLMLGTDVASKLTVSEAPFEDVPATAWYAPFVAFCAEKGLLEGYNGKFYPNEPINAYGFAKLLLGALGYRADIENLTGDTWQVNVATLAIQNGLFDGNDGAFANQDMTRQEACLYAFNALKANTVGYTGGTTITLPGGGSIVSGAVRYEKENTAEKDYRGEDDGDDKVQLCEALYPDLKMNNHGDSYGRPGHTWEYDETDIVVTDAAYATYASADFKDVLTKLDKDKKIKTTKDTVYTWNTDEIQNPDVELADGEYGCGLYAGKVTGATVELYVDGKEITHLVVVHPYVVTVDKIKTTKDETIVTLKNLSWSETEDKVNKTMTISSKSDKDAYALIEDYDEGDVFAAVFARDAFWEGKDSKVDASALLSVDDMETVDGKVTATSADWIKVDGEKYTFARAYSGAKVTTKDEGTFYIYNGYVMHYAVENKAVSDDQVAYILGVREEPDEWIKGDITYYANLLFADGTTKVVETNKDFNDKYGKGFRAVRYSVKDDVYSIIAGQSDYAASLTLKKGISKLGTSSSYANNDTIFVVLNFEGKKFDGAKVYTGVKNLPSLEVNAFYTFNNKDNAKMADYVFCTYGTDAAAETSDLIYVSGASKSDPIDDADLGVYCTYNAVVAGKDVEIMVANKEKVDGFYTAASTDENGVYTFDAKNAAKDKDITKVEGDFTKAAGGVVGIGDTFMTYANDVTVFVDDHGDVAEGSVNTSYASDDETTVTVYYTAKDDVVTSIYVVLTDAE